MPELNFSVLKDSPNLKAYYRFESGAELVDSSGNSNTLTAIGTPTYSAGKFGQGVDLASASSQAFSITDGATVKPTGAFTVGGWVKTSTANTIIAASYSQNTNYAGIFLYISAGGKLILLSGKNSGTTQNTDWQQALGATTITDNVWRHVVGTWDGATLRVYVNGAHDGSTAWANAPAYAATNYVRVGCYNTAGSNSLFFNGSLDDVFLLNGTALSADQIHELYEGRIVGEGWPQAGLVAGYHLNGNSTDFSGNNYHGIDTAITYSQANGKFGQGGGFNGSTSKILVANSSSLNITGNITVAGWVYMTGSPGSGARMTIARKGYEGVNLTRYSVCVYDSARYIEFRVVGAAGRSHRSNGVLPLNGWAYVVVTCDLNGGSVPTFYINGAPQAITAVDTGAATYANVSETQSLGIGADANSANLLAGNIDELTIFNVAKDANWVRKQYAWSRGKFL